MIDLGASLIEPDSIQATEGESSDDEAMIGHTRWAPIESLRGPAGR